jgi:hypothetical protein
MLRHDDKSDHTKPIPISHLLQNLQQKIASLGCAQQGMAIAATPSDEVQSSGLMEALQAPRHAFKIESIDRLVCDSDSQKHGRFPKAEMLSNPRSRSGNEARRSAEATGAPLLADFARSGDSLLELLYAEASRQTIRRITIVRDFDSIKDEALSN